MCYTVKLLSREMNSQSFHIWPSNPNGHPNQSLLSETALSPSWRVLRMDVFFSDNKKPAFFLRSVKNGMDTIVFKEIGLMKDKYALFPFLNGQIYQFFATLLLIDRSSNSIPSFLNDSTCVLLSIPLPPLSISLGVRYLLFWKDSSFWGQNPLEGHSSIDAWIGK